MIFLNLGKTIPPPSPHGYSTQLREKIIATETTETIDIPLTDLTQHDIDTIKAMITDAHDKQITDLTLTRQTIDNFQTLAASKSQLPSTGRSPSDIVTQGHGKANFGTGKS